MSTSALTRSLPGAERLPWVALAVGVLACLTYSLCANVFFWAGQAKGDAAWMFLAGLMGFAAFAFNFSLLSGSADAWAKGHRVSAGALFTLWLVAAALSMTAGIGFLSEKFREGDIVAERQAQVMELRAQKISGLQDDGLVQQQARTIEDELTSMRAEISKMRLTKFADGEEMYRGSPASAIASLLEEWRQTGVDVRDPRSYQRRTMELQLSQKVEELGDKIAAKERELREVYRSAASREVETGAAIDDMIAHVETTDVTVSSNEVFAVIGAAIGSDAVTMRARLLLLFAVLVELGCSIAPWAARHAFGEPEAREHVSHDPDDPVAAMQQLQKRRERESVDVQRERERLAEERERMLADMERRERELHERDRLSEERSAKRFQETEELLAKISNTAADVFNRQLDAASPNRALDVPTPAVAPSTTRVGTGPDEFDAISDALMRKVQKAGN